MPHGIVSIFVAMLCVLGAWLPASQASAQAKEGENVMLILDASGSMWGQVEGRTKIEIAREVVGEVLGGVKDTVRMGVIAYGHRSKGDCKDIETVLPVGKVDAARYMDVIGAINPKGKTPISEAVRRGAEELRFRENKATVVLVSDGLETCQADPCALAEELEKAGIDFTVHVVGFDLKKEDTTSLQCLAEKTGGRYLAAENAGELTDAIGEVVAAVQEPAAAPAKPEPEPEAKPTQLRVTVHLAEGTPPLESAYVYVIPAASGRDRSKAIERGSSWRQYKVPPGKYHLETKYGSATGSADTEVARGETGEARIILNAGYLSVKASEVEGGPLNEEAYVNIYEAEQAANGSRRAVTAGNQRNLFTLPAGRYYATARIGKATAGQEMEVKPGEKTEITLVLAAGTLKVEAIAEEGGKPLAEAYIRIFEPDQQADGSRKQVTAGNQRNVFEIPAGDYYVTATVGKASVGRDARVEAGKLTEMSLLLGVGALKITVVPADGAGALKGAYVDIQEADKQLDGSRKRVTAGNHTNTFKLPAGPYHVVASAGRARTGQDVEVTANKLTEVTVNLNAGSLQVKGDKSFFIGVFSAEKNLDGSRDRVGSLRPGQPLVLPAGKYFLEAKARDRTAEAEAEVTAGRLTEVEIK